MSRAQVVQYTDALPGGPLHIEWEEAYMQNKCEVTPGVFTSCDYGARYGLGCSDHDNFKRSYLELACDAEDPADRHSMCFDMWCYVDPDTCTAWSLSYASIYKPGLRYSMMTCDASLNLEDEESIDTYNACIDDQWRAIAEATFAGDAILSFGIVLALWVAPPLLLLAYALLQRCRRGRGDSSASVLPTWRSQRTLPSFRDPSEAAAVKKLDRAEKGARTLRLRVGGTSAQLGWMLLVLAMTPTTLPDVLGIEVSGRWKFLGNTSDMYSAALPWGLGCLLLTVRPIDANVIRLVGVCTIAVYVFFTIQFARDVGRVHLLYGGNIFSPLALAACLIQAATCLVCAVALWPLLVVNRCKCCRDSWRMAPRRQLHRLWLVVRLSFGGMALGYTVEYFEFAHAREIPRRPRTDCRALSTASQRRLFAASEVTHTC